MEYLKNNAILMCSCGVLPSILKVTSNAKIKNKDGVFATHKDNIGGINISSFGVCSIYGIWDMYYLGYKNELDQYGS